MLIITAIINVGASILTCFVLVVIKNSIMLDPHVSTYTTIITLIIYF